MATSPSNRSAMSESSTTNLFFAGGAGVTVRQLTTQDLERPGGSTSPMASIHHFDSPHTSCVSPTLFDLGMPSPGLSPMAGPSSSPKHSITLPSPGMSPGLETLLLRRSAFTPTSTSELQWREATAADVPQIVALTASLDMSFATSFVWSPEETRRRILTRSPLAIVAVEGKVVVGVAGIDVAGIEKPFKVYSIGSRVTKTPANEVFTIPEGYCLCRGLLVHPDHQGKGVGTLLHRGRLQCLHSLAPDTPGVVLSARGSSLEEALSILAPRLNHDDPSDLTPQFSKTEIFEFTFRTSLGVVHLAHGKDEQGWKFVGVDESDGGPVWCTNDSLANIVQASKVAAYKKKGFPAPLVQLPPPVLEQRKESFHRPLARRDTLPVNFQLPEAICHSDSASDDDDTTTLPPPAKAVKLYEASPPLG